MSMLKKLKARIVYLLLLDREPGSEVAAINLSRVIFLSFIMVPIHVVLIIFFWVNLSAEGPAAGDTVILWRTAIITAHGAMLVIVLATGLLSAFIRRKNLELTKPGQALPLVNALLYLFFGVIVCIADQLVTASINPYLISSIAVAMIVVMHPRYAVTFYSAAFILFFFALPVTQADSDLLLSVRVNGISVAGIGLALSILFWRNSMTTLLHRKLIKTQHQELENKNKQLQDMVRTDVLTGLYNRMRFTEFVELELARIKRSGEESCLIFLDLDHFKNVNDTYGHPNGDLVLKWVAGVIKGQLRTTDILARFGGEEFSILLPDTSLEGACKVAEKIRAALEGCSFIGQMEDMQITASFGVSTLKRDKPDAFNLAYREADKALYQAKDKGRNRVEPAP